jgi:negative regulator of sigma E activity
MILDDDSLLSAYIDGELGPDQQQSIESALVSDPQLAERFRHLTTVRDLLAGLSREEPVDVTRPVMNRIRRHLRLRAILAAVWLATPATQQWQKWARTASLGMAATILIVLSISLVRPRLGPLNPAEATSNPVTADLNISPQPTTSIPQPDAPEQQEPSFVSRTPGEGASSPLESRDRPSRNPQGVSARVLEPTEIEHARQYLDHPALRHVLMVADMDGTAQQQVASVVEQTTRFHYMKITIAQGIVIDPRHPDQATVFALVVSPRDFERLRHQLRVVLKDRVEEAPPDPRIVTQLADIDDVQTFKPVQAGEVVIPRDALAIQHPDGGRPTPEQYRSEPVPDLAPSQPRATPRSRLAGAGAAKSAETSASAPAPAANRVAARSDARGPGGPPEPGDQPDQNLVVLVWVSRTRSGIGH